MSPRTRKLQKALNGSVEPLAPLAEQEALPGAIKLSRTACGSMSPTPQDTKIVSPNWPWLLPE
ncbi:MAG: hypothetical protein WCP58_07435 [bacterium]